MSIKSRISNHNTGFIMAFLDYFEDLDDPRSHINQAHDLFDVLFLTIAAILSGAEGWQDIKDFGDQKLDWLRKFRAFEHGIPVDDTIARIISRLDPDKFVECFINWANSLRLAEGRETIAIDGKTLRRSFKEGDRKSALHLISVWSDANQLVLGQFKSKGKKNEINTIMELLELIDIQGATITLDAMGSQKKIAKKIRARGGHYVLPLKDNQKKMHQEALAFLHKVDVANGEGYELDTYTETDAGHGRIEVRHYTQVAITDWVSEASNWKDAKSIIKVVRERHIKDECTLEEQTYLSSHDVDVKNVAHSIRRHWGVENQVHWRMDVTFREDDSRIRRKHAAQNMASLRRFVMNLASLHPDKKSMRRKLKNCGWDDDFREKLLFG